LISPTYTTYQEPISKFPAAVDPPQMRNGSVDGRTVGTHSEAFSGGAYSRGASWTQAGSDPSCAGSGAVGFSIQVRNWHALPQSYPNYKTVHRRFHTWCCNEILHRVLTDVANELRDKRALDEEECFIDATFVMAKDGGRKSEQRSAEKA
jgi:hypothetical protein